MSSSLNKILGINPADPIVDRARRLREADRELLRELRRCRDDAGLSQTEVARRMDVSQQAVSRIERADRDLNQDTIRRYALAVGAMVDHIVTRHEAVTDSVRQMDEQLAKWLAPVTQWSAPPTTVQARKETASA